MRPRAQVFPLAVSPVIVGSRPSASLSLASKADGEYELITSGAWVDDVAGAVRAMYCCVRALACEMGVQV
ncbi:MAG: hypothetical protein ACREYA_22975 [Cupriavidus necator]